MAADWVPLCSAKDLTIYGNHVDVSLEDGRGHRIIVTDEGKVYRIRGIVVRRATVASLPNLPIQVWKRNRTTHLVGFRIDRKMRLIAEAWPAKPGLTAEEFQFYLRTLAAECDRFEYILTGGDVQ
jgi:hypothetical protein